MQVSSVVSPFFGTDVAVCNLVAQDVFDRLGHSLRLFAAAYHVDVPELCVVEGHGGRGY